MSNLNEVELIAEISARGSNIQLLMDEGASFGKANTIVTAFYKEEGLQSERSGGFRAKYYDFLRDEARSEDEARIFVTEHGSDNDKKSSNKGHWESIRKLVEDVRS